MNCPGVGEKGWDETNAPELFATENPPTDCARLAGGPCIVMGVAPGGGTVGWNIVAGGPANTMLG